VLIDLYEKYFQMIKFIRFTLSNGLRVIIHEDRSTPMVAMNILYDVGSRDEDPESTGLAHLFEHLMFGGTPEVPDFDTQLQLAGGENNAFTSADITNYYITLPKENIETGFWLESDRMNLLDFSQRNLDIQKKVVLEEFNQRYLNRPYGDSFLKLKPLAYKVHPYRWPTIGMEAEHIRKCNLQDIRDFFFSHYAPNNAILSLAGNLSPERAYMMAEKWFGRIEKRNVIKRKLPVEPKQNKPRTITLKGDVPASALFKAWHMGPRLGTDYLSLDLITDLLAGGESGRLNSKLVREKKLFSTIDAYITSDIDPGLLIVHGKLMKGADITVAETSLNKMIDDLIEKAPSSSEMEKVKNKNEASTLFENTSVLNKAMHLAYYELLGNPDMINTETDQYRRIERAAIPEITARYLNNSNCSTLYYLPDQTKRS
jgi:zinc protease